MKEIATGQRSDDGIMSKDYRVEIKIKNNKLMSAIESLGFSSMLQFSKATGINYSIISNLVGMKVSPYMKNGKIRPIVNRICTALNLMPCDLFNDQQIHNPIIDNKRTLELSSPELLSLDSQSKAEELLESKGLTNAANKVLSLLTDREAFIVENNVMNESMKLEQLADHFGISSERIRQIREKALRKLRHPSRAKILIEHTSSYPNTERHYNQEK